MIKSLINDYGHLKKRIKEEMQKIEYFADNESFKTLSNLLISAEDHRFRFHLGFDIIAITRAIKNNIFYNKKEGASTIEQQLVRTILNDYDKTLYRKCKEVFLAFLLKFITDKKHISFVYLNIAYYGTKFDNLEKILKKYDLKKGDKFDIEICAEIISRLKYPEPKAKSEKRSIQIQNRKRHIINLFYRHKKYKFFKIHE